MRRKVHKMDKNGQFLKIFYAAFDPKNDKNDIFK